MIDSTTNFIEHPEFVAQRIARYADVVGRRSNVIAGVDCGFATFADAPTVLPAIAWAKLGALAEGRAPRQPEAVGTPRITGSSNRPVAL